MASRESPFTWLINNKEYMAVRSDGAPVYDTQGVPKIAGETAQIAEEERPYSSLHGGFGFSRYLIPNTYDYADCMDTTRPRRIVMPPLVTSATALASVTGGFVELGSTFWVGAGRYLQNIDTSDDTLDVPDGSDYTKGKDFGSGAVISSMQAWDGLIDVWFSSATNGFTFTGSTAPTELSGSAVKRIYSAKFWSEAAGAYEQAGSATTTTVTWIPSGGTLDSAIGAGWSAAYLIGDTTKTITGLGSGKTMVWVTKKDGLYYVDGRSGRTPRVVEFFPVDDSNGVGVFVDSVGRVWCPTKGGLLRYNPNNGAVEDVTPGRGLSHDATIYGRVTAVAQYKGWYYASVYNGTTSYVMVGRDRDEGEPGIGPVVWHGAITKLTGQISHLYVLGSTSPPRLYMAAGTTVAYIRLDASYRYAASGSLYFPADNMGLVNSRWQLAGYLFSCKGFNTSTYADLYAKIDRGDWQLVGRLQASGRVFLPIPAGDWRFTELAFRLDVTNSSSTTTPEIWGITQLATRRVYSRPLIHTSLICSKEVLSHYDMTPRRSGAEMIAELEALAVERSVTAVDFLTGERRSRSVLVQPIRTRLVRFGEKDKWEEWAEVADVTMVAQSSETVQTEASQVQKWNTGVKWNSGAKWG